MKKKEYPENLLSQVFVNGLPTELPDDVALVLEYIIQKTLTEREGRVLDMRYKRHMTMAAIGEEYGLRAERIRQIEASRLLFYLQDKQIHSVEDFQKAVAAANERAEDLKNQKAELIKKISDTEKMIEEIPQYLEILNRRPLMPNDIKELSKFTHLQDVGVISLDDAERLKVQIEEMKKFLVSLEEQLKTALSEKKTASDFYTAYENQMKSDYQILLEQAKAELENLRREEERQRAELERSEVQEERKPQSRKKTGFSL